MKRSPLFVIFVVVFLDLLGFGIVIPQLGIYGYHFGANGFLIGCLGSAYSAMQFLCAPWLGRLSDRFGRRPVILVSLAGSVAGYVVFGLATSLTWLFVGRLVQGLCGGNISTAQAYIADVTPKELRARNMGMYLGAAFGLGFIFGPAVGSLLSAYGNLALGLAAAAMSLSALLLAWISLPESLPAEKRGRATAAEHGAWFGGTREVMRLPSVGLVVALFFLVTFAFSTMEGVFALYVIVRFFAAGAAKLGTSALVTLSAHNDPVARSAGMWTGLLFVAIGVVSTAVQGRFIGPLKRRFGEARLVCAGVISMALALVLIPLAPELGALFPVMALLAVGSGLNSPSLASLISQLAPAERQGEVIGVYQSMGSLARTFGPAAGGLTFELFGPRTPFFGAGMLMIGSLVLAVRLLQRPISADEVGSAESALSH